MQLLHSIPCEKIFVVHYEHILGDPMSYLGPMSSFLGLNEHQKKVYKMIIHVSSIWYVFLLGVEE